MISIGLERVVDDPPARLSRGRLGLLTNLAATDRAFRPAHELLIARYGSRVRALFGPQHGFAGAQQDNMIETPHGRDATTGVRVHSLYGAERRPTPEMLADLDVLVCDLPDVGTRVYTYVWTLDLALEACAAAGVAVCVLDRPNPLGGVVVEGPRLEPGHESFVGRAPLPMRHALTLGELARWLVRTRSLDVDLTVVPVAGWRRDDTFAELGRGWVPPSPNLPRFEGARVYPGQVLFEGVDLSEGRGTTTPFELVGAPWLDGAAWRRRLEERALPGVAFRALSFEPTFHLHAGRTCGGVFVHVTDPAAARPYRTAVELLASARALDPERFAWRAPPYEYEHERWPIDVISGSERLRVGLETGVDPVSLSAVDVDAWRNEVAADLLYEPDRAFDA